MYCTSGWLIFDCEDAGFFIIGMCILKSPRAVFCTVLLRMAVSATSSYSSQATTIMRKSIGIPLPQIYFIVHLHVIDCP
jgi:hypothetical protein